MQLVMNVVSWIVKHLATWLLIQKLSYSTSDRKAQAEMLWGAYGLLTMPEAGPLLSLFDPETDGSPSQEKGAS